jgi:hypothetical protein
MVIDHRKDPNDSSVSKYSCAPYMAGAAIRRPHLAFKRRMADYPWFDRRARTVEREESRAAATAPTHHLCFGSRSTFARRFKARRLISYTTVRVDAFDPLAGLSVFGGSPQPNPRTFAVRGWEKLDATPLKRLHNLGQSPHASVPFLLLKAGDSV